MNVARRILIIDDEPDMLEWLSEVVTSVGYTPIATTLPTAGLVMACEQKPDLVVVTSTCPG